MKAEAKDSEVQATSPAFVQMQQDVTFVSVGSKCFKMSLIRPIGETIVKWLGARRWEHDMLMGAEADSDRAGFSLL